MFRGLAETDEGLRTLYMLAKTGMRAWDCSSDVVRCLEDAFRDITFRVLIISALQHFADTAVEKITFPPPDPPHHPQPPKPKLRPESSRPIHPRSSFGRPRPRGGMTPSP